MVLLALSYVLLSSTHHRPEFVLLSLVWNCVGLVFVVYLVVAEYLLGAICPLCTAVHVLTCAQSYLSYRALMRLLGEKSHLRAEDLVGATLIGKQRFDADNDKEEEEEEEAFFICIIFV